MLLISSTYLSHLKNTSGEWSNGFRTLASSPQSVLCHMRTDPVARNSPTRSQHTPLTNP